MEPKTRQNGCGEGGGVPHRTVRWGTPLPSPKNQKKKSQRYKEEGIIPQSRPMLGEKVANMAPT